MDKFLRIAALFAVTAAAASPAIAAPTAPVGVTPTPATATAQIVEPLTLTKSSDLSFGTLIKNGITADQTVSISEAGVVTCPAQLLCGGTTFAAEFDVEGSADQIVKVYVASSLLTSGTNSLLFTPAAATASPLTLDTNGDASFAVGGSIIVKQNTPTGIYVGNMDVTVDYN